MTCSPITGTPEQKVRELSDLAARWSQDPLVRSTAAGRSLELLLSTVQLLPYRTDRHGADDVCDPATLFRDGGDCEDRAALFAALARVAGARVVIVWQPQQGVAEDHVTTKVFLDGAWRWADPTVPGARIGEEPHDAVARLGAHAERLG